MIRAAATPGFMNSSRSWSSPCVRCCAAMLKALDLLQLALMHGYPRLFIDESVLQRHGRGSL